MLLDIVEYIENEITEDEPFTYTIHVLSKTRAGCNPIFNLALNPEEISGMYVQAISSRSTMLVIESRVNKKEFRIALSYDEAEQADEKTVKNLTYIANNIYHAIQFTMMLQDRE